MNRRIVLPRSTVCLAAVAVLLSAPSTSLADRCGGTERWFVKVGTDPKANQVDVAHPIQSSVAELNALPQLRDQVPSGNNTMRLDEETKVYTVTGFLALFKDEDDSDYHLVITDASLTYTPGGPNSNGKETGTSFIAEIPDPDCIAGKHGNPAAHSAFEAALMATRQKFETRFPGGKGADTKLNIPVTVTGVAFYDRQHLQTGRAQNGLELHPLLDISFPGTSVPVEEGPPTTLLTNPGFEQGETGWTGTTSAIGEYPHQPAHGGAQICWLDGYGARKTETLAQKLSLPGGAQTITLGFWVTVESEETTASAAYDVCTVQLRSSSGTVLRTLATFSNLTETGGYLHKTFDLSAFKGRDVQIYIKASEDADKATSFVFDDFSLTVH